MTTIDNIRANLIKNFNNDILIVVSAELSYIVSNKHVMDSSDQIFADIINNLFGNLSFFSIFLPSSFFFSSLPASTTGNSGNIPTIFISYMFICI